MSTPPNEPTPREDPAEPKAPEPDETAARREPENPPRREATAEPAFREPAGPAVPAREPAGPAVPAAPAPGTGQHAAPRPYPPSPGDQAGAAPSTTSTPPGASWSPGQGAAQRPASSPPPSAAPSTAPPPTQTGGPDAHGAATVREEPVRDLPEPPARPGMGRHLLAALLGLVLTPFALTLVGIGTGRLADIAGTTDMGTDLLGGTLLSLGVLMLAVIVLLGVWSAALPIVGGLVWGVGLGAAYLVVPTAMRDGAEAMTADGNVPVEVEQLANAGMSGSLLVLGALLVAAGLAVSLARRQGRRFAERVSLADRARLDAEREGAVNRAH